MKDWDMMIDTCQCIITCIMTSSAVDTQLNNEQRLQFIKASSSNAGLTAECH